MVILLLKYVCLKFSENNHLINQINILAQSKNTQNNEMDNLHKKIIDYSKMIKNLESNLDQTEAELTSLKQNMALYAFNRF